MCLFEYCGSKFKTSKFKVQTGSNQVQIRLKYLGSNFKVQIRFNKQFNRDYRLIMANHEAKNYVERKFWLFDRNGDIFGSFLTR
eukprot:Pgem_evm1s1205